MPRGKVLSSDERIKIDAYRDAGLVCLFERFPKKLKDPVPTYIIF